MSRAAYGVRPVLLRQFRIRSGECSVTEGDQSGKEKIEVEEADFDDDAEVEVTVDPVSDEEVTPLDAAEEAEADFYAAQEKIEEPVDLEFSPTRCSSS